MLAPPDLRHTPEHVGGAERRGAEVSGGPRDDFTCVFAAAGDASIKTPTPAVTAS